MIRTLQMLPPLLLLIGGCAFIAPSIIINSGIELRKIWTRGVLVISLAHFLVSAIILTAIPPAQFAAGEFVHPIFLGPYLIATLPLVVFLRATFIAYLGNFCWLFYLFNSFLWSIPVAAICYRMRRKQERETTKRQEIIESAIAKITADGVIEGPKGPYVPLKKWNVGTPHATEPLKARSYDGGPWPD